MNTRAAAAALIGLLILVLAAVLITRRIGAADAVQDCVMQGRTNCASVR